VLCLQAPWGGLVNESVGRGVFIFGSNNAREKKKKCGPSGWNNEAGAKTMKVGGTETS
jgi:hypothetical protein